MNLLITPRLSQTGGVSHFYQGIMPYLPKLRHLEVGGKHDEFKLLKPFRLLFDWLKFIAICISNRFEFVHFNPSFNRGSVSRDLIYWLTAILLRKRYILMFHGWDNSFAQLALQKPWLAKLLSVAFTHATQILVLTNDAQDYLSANFAITKTQRYRTFYEPVTAENNSDQRQLSPIKFIFMSRIEQAKGIREMCAAFLQLTQIDQNIELHILGSGNDESFIENWKTDHKLNKVFLHGWLNGEAKYDVLSQCHYYLLPSYTEGLPSSLLEAMQAGLVSITTPVGAIKDNFTNLDFVYLVPEKNTDALFQAMRTVVEKHTQQFKKLSPLARAHVENTFSIAATVQQLKPFY